MELSLAKLKDKSCDNVLSHKADLSFSLEGLPAAERSNCSLPYEAFLQALHGFILVTTAQGRLVYVSENVAEYLGLSMVSQSSVPCQCEAFYFLVYETLGFNQLYLKVKPLVLPGGYISRGHYL